MILLIIPFALAIESGLYNGWGIYGERALT